MQSADQAAVIVALIGLFGALAGVLANLVISRRTDRKTRQLEPNGGSSLADQVARIDARSAANWDTLADRIDTLESRFDARFDRLVELVAPSVIHRREPHL